MKFSLKKIIIFTAILGIAVIPLFSFAATNFRYGAWLPFWKKQTGAQEVALRLEKFSEISPFSYEVRADGTLVDKLKINEGLWPVWLSASRDMKIEIIPTIAWFDGDSIHDLLSNKTTRIKHEDAILKLVKQNKFDGIDIDYEAKLAETNKYFATFIYGLAIRLHPIGKKLICTIEPRMPVDSRLNRTGTDADTQYANDYVALNKYCDEVRIMAYDQGVIDIKLDNSKGNGQLYAPVADPDWVTKIINEATKTISKKKIMLGIPTYGYEYEVSWQNGITTYKRLRSHSYFQAIIRAASVNAVPSRNSAGELSFTYATSTAVSGVSAVLIWNIPSNSAPSEIAKNSANGKVTRFVSFSDSQAISQKIALAKKLGLRGVVFFKMDGETDPTLWGKIK